jgi:P-type Cu+ transporter
MADTKRDPVCGMDVAASQSVSMKHKGQDYAFCSDQCRDKFKSDPAMYGGSSKA